MLDGCVAAPGSNSLYRITPDGTTLADHDHESDTARDDLEACLDCWLVALSLEPFPQ
ncbi:MAG: hypothetical protein WEB19_05525 [Acidimicrobiia bacterium]